MLDFTVWIISMHKGYEIFVKRSNGLSLQGFWRITSPSRIPISCWDTSSWTCWGLWLFPSSQTQIYQGDLHQFCQMYASNITACSENSTACISPGQIWGGWSPSRMVWHGMHRILPGKYIKWICIKLKCWKIDLLSKFEQAGKPGAKQDLLILGFSWIAQTFAGLTPRQRLDFWGGFSFAIFEGILIELPSGNRHSRAFRCQKLKSFETGMQVSNCHIARKEFRFQDCQKERQNPHSYGTRIFSRGTGSFQKVRMQNWTSPCLFEGRCHLIYSPGHKWRKDRGDWTGFGRRSLSNLQSHVWNCTKSIWGPKWKASSLCQIHPAILSEKHQNHARLLASHSFEE